MSESDQLARLLEHGPFHEALAAAVAQRGLTLARLRHHLTVRGSQVSVPTLSCWMRGTRRPERPDSLRALAELEVVLGLEPRALSDLLGQPRRRGRDAARPLPDSQLWTPSRSLQDAFRELAMPRPDLRMLSVHVRQWVDARGVETQVRHLNVVESTRDGTHRLRVTLARMAGSQRAARVHAVSGARTGRMLSTDDGFVVGELLLDTRLDKGERSVVEFAADLDPDGGRSLSCAALFHRPVHQVVLEVYFDPAATPERAYALRRPAGKREQRDEVELSDAGVLRVVLLDQPAGEYGLTWTWPPG